MIGELKVRFQHGCANDPEGYKARCGLLAEDMADAPPLLLRLAIAQWVRESPFLPTAADLTRIMREELERRDKAAAPAEPPPGYDWAASFCNLRNAALERLPTDERRGEWAVVNGEPKLVPFHRDPPPPPIDRIDPSQVEIRNRALRKYGATFRYDRNGRDFDLKPGEPDPTDPSSAEPL